MIALALSVTYVGAVLCYVASSSSASRVDGEGGGVVSPRLLRWGGLMLMGGGFGLSVTSQPVTEGVLVWLSMGMAAFSLLVIAAPLVDRFIPVTSALALAIAGLALWL